ncbi:hypothetical protein BGW38_000502, partial [Lunasporangiospora selenospora]
MVSSTNGRSVDVDHAAERTDSLPLDSFHQVFAMAKTIMTTHIESELQADQILSNFYG